VTEEEASFYFIFIAGLVFSQRGLTKDVLPPDGDKICGFIVG